MVNPVPKDPALPLAPVLPTGGGVSLSQGTVVFRQAPAIVQLFSALPLVVRGGIFGWERRQGPLSDRVLVDGEPVDLVRGYEYLGGTAPQCHLRLADPSLSKEHFLLRFDPSEIGWGDVFPFEEGVRRNGEPLPAERTTFLRAGDLLEIGGYCFTVAPLPVTFSIPEQGTYVFRPGESFLIGRGPECAIRFSGDASLSRQHARIHLKPGRDGVVGYVTDLGSENGTKVVGEEKGEFPLGRGEKYPLVVGDAILIGSIRLFVGDTPPPEYRQKGEEDVTQVLAHRFHAHGDQFPPWYRPENRRHDQIWTPRPGNPKSQKRLIAALRPPANDLSRRRQWRVNFVVRPHPRGGGKYQIVVGVKYWEGQKVSEEGVKHVQLSKADAVIWAGELNGIFDDQGELTQLQFNAQSGEYGRLLMSRIAERLRDVRETLAHALSLKLDQVVYDGSYRA